MGKALVLNITDVPLSVVAARRAIILVMAGKADPISSGTETVHSEHLSMNVPSVIRLRYFVSIPFVRPRSISRRSIFARDGNKCQYCGRKADSIDHVIPKSKGGKHIWENVVAACRACNSNKRDKLLSETALKLLQKPRTPGHFASLLLSGGEMPKHWAPYLLSSLVQ